MAEPEYIKLVCTFYTHPKLAAVSGDAAYFWICSIGYCCTHHTDGVLPTNLRAILPWSPKRIARVEAELLGVNLWFTADERRIVHEFERYQPYHSKREHDARTARKLAEQERWKQSKRTHRARKKAAQQLAITLETSEPSRANDNHCPVDVPAGHVRDALVGGTNDVPAGQHRDVPINYLCSSNSSLLFSADPDRDLTAHDERELATARQRAGIVFWAVYQRLTAIIAMAPAKPLAACVAFVEQQVGTLEGPDFERGAERLLRGWRAELWVQKNKPALGHLASNPERYWDPPKQGVRNGMAPVPSEEDYERAERDQVLPEWMRDDYQPPPRKGQQR